MYRLNETWLILRITIGVPLAICLKIYLLKNRWRRFEKTAITAAIHFTLRIKPNQIPPLFNDKQFSGCGVTIRPD